MDSDTPQPRWDQIAQLFSSTEEDTKTQSGSRQGRSVEESAMLGRASLSDGNFSHAVEHFKRAVAQAGETPSAERYLDLGSAYEVTDQAPEAYRQYRIAANLRSDSPDPLVGLGDILKRDGRYRDAVRELTKAIELQPKSAYLFTKLAETLSEMGERRKAVEAARQAVGLAPDEWFHHFLVGNLLISTEDYEEAIKAFRAAVELSPGDDYLFVRTAVAFWLSGRREDAVRAIRLASELNPDSNFYHGLLKELLEQLGEEEGASLEIDRAEKMDRYDLDLLGRLMKEMKIPYRPS